MIAIVSNPFKSSLFGKSFGFEGLAKIMNNNAEILSKKDMTGRSKAVVSAAMKTTNTKDEFVKALQEKAIDVVFRTNDAGRIYGVTFIDHENKVVLNGSRLGKSFSANVFHDWFNEGKQPLQRFQKRESNPVQTQNNENRDTTAESSKSMDTSTIEELFGIFDLNPQGENYEEIAFARKMRKKKRKKTINH